MREWARQQGFKSTISDYHTTVLYSTTPLARSALPDDIGHVHVPPGEFTIKPIGDQGAVALYFASDDLASRHDSLVARGGSHDYASYQPHLTITYDGGGIDPATVQPYDGELLFGPEEFQEIEPDKRWQPPHEIALLKDYDPDLYCDGISLNDADNTTISLITRLFALDRQNPWFGQTVEGVPPLTPMPMRDAGPPDEPRDPQGKWTSGGSGQASGAQGSSAHAILEHGGNYGLVPGDVAKFEGLKSQWAKVNNDLLEHVDKPDGSESQAALDKLEAIVKEMHGLHADPGTPAGIGYPGGPRDVTIVGAGPGGLAAGINGAAEGLDTLIVEANAVAGGQAKYSSRIENFGGFPIGVTGERLTQNMFEQAQRLGAETKLGTRVTSMTYDESTGMKHLTLSNGEHIDSRTVILAGGVEFRRMAFPGADGPGVIIGDGKTLAEVGKGGRVCVIGGSNGAAQAALGCAQLADHVYLLTRSPIVKSMSKYQVDALRNNPKITVIESDSIAKLFRDEHGNPQLMETVKGQRLPINAVGEFLGGLPDTKWVPTTIALGKGGAVPTNANLETTLPGVYAVGDVREGAIGRVGVAYGEGQLALRQANVFLDKQRYPQADSAARQAAGVIFITPEGEALFVHRARGSDHAGEWSIPAGGVEPGEIIQAAAHREAAEEVGYPGDWTLTLLDRRTTAGVDFFTYLQRVPQKFGLILNAEHDQYLWAPLDQAPGPLHPGLEATLNNIDMRYLVEWDRISDFNPWHEPGGSPIGGKFAHAEGGGGAAIHVGAAQKLSSQVNPLSPPAEVSEKLNRKINRKSDAGEPKTGSVELVQGQRLGKVTYDQWKQRVSTFLTPKELTDARTWYSSALPTYEHFYGKELAAPMMGAWLIANVHVSPAGAVLNATRVLEQAQNKTPTFSKQKLGGLTDKKLRLYWDAVLAGNGQRLEQLGSGQKIFDFIDSALGKTTRTFYGDDPRAGAPAVADIWSLRDMGFVDEAAVNWTKEKFGAAVAKKLKIDSKDLSPGEAQYEWTADKMRDFTAKLNAEKFDGGGWTPAQMQAVGWTAMRKMFGADPVSPSEALEAHIRNLSYELDFGEGAPYNQKFPDWSKLNVEQKARVTHEVMPKILDFATKLAGAHEFARIEGTGGWHEFTNPAYRSRLIASEEVAGDVADTIGYLAQQTKIYGYRATPTGNKTGIAIYGDGLKDQDKVKAIWGEIVKTQPDFAAGFSPSINADDVHGMEIVFDKGGEKLRERVSTELVPAIDRITKNLGIAVDVHDFRAEDTSHENDWTRDKEGGGYLQGLTARYGPNIQGRLELFGKTELEPVLAAAIERELGGKGKAAEVADAGEFIQDPLTGRFMGSRGLGGAAAVKAAREAKAAGLGLQRIGHGYSPEAHLVKGVIHTDNVADATRALWEGKHVVLNQPREVATLLEHLGQVVKHLTALGSKAPNFNLCNVSVAHSNLFCEKSLGIPRIKMPQMDDNQTKEFRKYLQGKGYTITKTQELASHLRATQNELIGVKVANLVNRILGGEKQSKRLVVSKDNYILDGHHHWAGTVGADAIDNKLTKYMKVARVNIGIVKLLEEAERFTGGKGHVGIGDAQALRKFLFDIVVSNES